MKSIQLSGFSTTDMQVFYEPMANLVVICDSKGVCHPYFLNLYKSKANVKGKPI